MLAIEVLSHHHRSILFLFRRYWRIGPNHPTRKRELFERIKLALKIQFTVEEEMVYPALTRISSSELGHLDSVLEEHVLIDYLLVSLTEIQERNRAFDRRMDTLSRRVKEHLRLEQQGPYQELRRRLNPERQAMLGNEIRARIDLISQAAMVS